jgi:hypothetical protein
VVYLSTVEARREALAIAIWCGGCGQVWYEQQPGADAAVPDAAAADARFDATGVVEDASLDAQPADAPLDDASVPIGVTTYTVDALAGNANFGEHVASDGVRLAVAALQSGGRVVVLAPGGAGTWVRELDAPPHVASPFGFTVAIAGDQLFLGNYQRGRGGLVEHWQRSGATWAWVENVEAPDAVSLDFFGQAVATCGDRLFVGAPGYATGGAPDNTGRVVIFDGPGLSAITTVEPPIASGQRFGRELDCGGDRLVVADGLTMRLWRLEAGAWVVDGDVVAADFACSLALAPDGLRLAVGECSAPSDRQVGRVRLFERIGGAWVASGEVVAPTPIEGSQFGIDVALDAETLLVGADGRNVAGGPLDGAVHQFRLGPGGWEHVDAVTAEVGADGRFGHSVAMASGHGAAGAPWQSVGGLARAGTLGVWHLR